MQDTPAMELSDSESIRRLIAPAARGPRRRRTPSAVNIDARRRAARRRCACGQCAQCRDDAKWNRIFNEKFADPEYYRSQRIRMSSPLG